VLALYPWKTDSTRCILIASDQADSSQESFIKLGFHLIMFFFYLYSMIVALIRDSTALESIRRKRRSGQMVQVKIL
jgi:hypothetical protein